MEPGLRLRRRGLGSVSLRIRRGHRACARAVSVLAAATMADLGLPEVLSTVGGLTARKDAGLPAEDAHADI